MITKFLSFISKDIRKNPYFHDSRDGYALKIHNLTFLLCLLIALVFFGDAGYNDHSIAKAIIDFTNLNLTEHPNAVNQLKVMYLVMFPICFLSSLLFFFYYAIFVGSIKIYFTIIDFVIFLFGFSLINVAGFLGTWVIASYIGFLPYTGLAVFLQTAWIIKALSIYVVLVFNLFSRLYYTTEP